MRKAQRLLNAPPETANTLFFEDGDGSQALCWHGRFVMLAKSCMLNGEDAGSRARRVYQVGGLSLAIDKDNVRHLRSLAARGFNGFTGFATKYLAFLRGKHKRLEAGDYRPFLNWTLFITAYGGSDGQS
jgi:hypothetical protein